MGFDISKFAKQSDGSAYGTLLGASANIYGYVTNDNLFDVGIAAYFDELKGILQIGDRIEVISNPGLSFFNRMFIVTALEPAVLTADDRSTFNFLSGTAMAPSQVDDDTEAFLTSVITLNYPTFSGPVILSYSFEIIQIMAINGSTPAGPGSLGLTKNATPNVIGSEVIPQTPNVVIPYTSLHFAHRVFPPANSLFINPTGAITPGKVYIHIRKLP